MPCTPPLGMLKLYTRGWTDSSTWGKDMHKVTATVFFSNTQLKGLVDLGSQCSAILVIVVSEH